MNEKQLDKTLREVLENHEKYQNKFNLDPKDPEWLRLSNDETGRLFLNANLNHSHLTGSSFKYANLGYSDFSNCSLFFANLQDSIMQNVNLDGADLRYSSIKDVNIQGAHLCNIDFTDAYLTGSKIKRSQLDTMIIEEDVE